MEFELNIDQQKAIEKSTSLPFSIITGGAGVGKTTIIKEIAKQLPTVALCCPTGKAAARLREVAEMPASTIHSMLGYMGSGFTCKSLEWQNIIIDESSMLDSWLLAEIIKRKPESLTLIGDNAQLPAVGKGQPFHDLISLCPDKATQLNICYRNSEAIYKAASAIRAGQQPENAKSDSELFRMQNTGDVDKTIAYIIELIQAGEIDFEQDIVVCCKNENVNAFNEAVMRAVNPHDENEKWKSGDRIICKKNFSKIDVWNGTTGTITDIDGAGRAWVKGDIPFYSAELDEMVEQILWDKVVLRECQPAYALTVHKSQGSQYRKVFICIFNSDKFALSRALIYTAVTRAKHECHVLGHLGTFRNGINQVASKRTVLQELAKKNKPANKNTDSDNKNSCFANKNQVK